MKAAAAILGVSAAGLGVVALVKHNAPAAVFSAILWLLAWDMTT